jgi:hypothetical protein
VEVSNVVCSAAEQTDSGVWDTVASGDKVEGKGAKPPGNFEIFGLIYFKILISIILLSLNPMSI